MFNNRKQAGEKLAKALKKYKERGVLVLAIPKGGAEVGCEVARYLGAEFSIIIARKLPFPDNPEAGFGAIAEDGSMFIFENVKDWFAKDIIDRISKQERQEIKRRIQVLRKGRPLPEIKNRQVILVDDGIAMGSTMRVSIMLCKNRKAKKVIVAVPVAGADTIEEIRPMVDEMVVLEKPVSFHAVAQVYRNWYDVPDEEVIEILNRFKV